MSKANKRKIKLKMDIDLSDKCSDKCVDKNDDKSDISEDIKPSVSPNDTTVLDVINELNDLIIAKRDFIIESFASKRGPIGRDQIKDYLNQMTEIVTNKRDQILSSTSSSTTTNTSQTNCDPIDEDLKECETDSISNINEISENQSLDKTSVIKAKKKTKPKNIQKSTKRRKSVGRKGIGKLLFDYRNRNRIPDYQKRLKYVEKDPNIDILHKKIGLVSTRLSAISESDEI